MEKLSEMISNAVSQCDPSASIWCWAYLELMALAGAAAGLLLIFAKLVKWAYKKIRIKMKDLPYIFDRLKVVSDNFHKKMDDAAINLRRMADFCASFSDFCEKMSPHWKKLFKELGGENQS